MQATGGGTLCLCAKEKERQLERRTDGRMCTCGSGVMNLFVLLSNREHKSSTTADAALDPETSIFSPVPLFLPSPRWRRLQIDSHTTLLLSASCNSGMWQNNSRGSSSLQSCVMNGGAGSATCSPLTSVQPPFILSVYIFHTVVRHMSQFSLKTTLAVKFLLLLFFWSVVF